MGNNGILRGGGPNLGRGCQTDTQQALSLTFVHSVSLWMVGKWRPALRGCNGAGRQLKPARLGTAGQQPNNVARIAIPRRQQIMWVSDSRSHVLSGLIAKRVEVAGRIAVIVGPPTSDRS